MKQKKQMSQAMQVFTGVVMVIAAGILIAIIAAASGVGYFQPHGCHYIAKKDFLGNHIYVCPKSHHG